MSDGPTVGLGNQPRGDRIAEVMEAILRFRDDRGWAPVHRPRNLAAALVVEAAELLEILLWKSDQEAEDALRSPEARSALRQELGDVLMLSFLLCHTLGVDPIDTLREKLAISGAKYPVGDPAHSDEVEPAPADRTRSVGD
jgi:NTP pyrophosphatase (non-canonical NTP hydrolase)